MCPTSRYLRHVWMVMLGVWTVVVALLRLASACYGSSWVLSLQPMCPNLWWEVQRCGWFPKRVTTGKFWKFRNPRFSCLRLFQGFESCFLGRQACCAIWLLATSWMGSGSQDHCCPWASTSSYWPGELCWNPGQVKDLIDVDDMMVSASIFQTSLVDFQ